MMKELQEEILRLKKETGAAILAHSYQSPEILEIADICGDSFALSVAAQKRAESTIVLCGVRFMADTVKLLNPEKKVLLPVDQAVCPMADQIPPERVRRFKENHPDYTVVAYINTTTRLKAECDVCVTSSSALAIVKKLPDTPILFIPDANLGGWLKRQLPEREIELWDGCCPVHAAVTARDCALMKERYPKAKLAVHPECREEVLAYADFVGSTSGILSFAEQCKEDVIIGTEKSISDWLSLHHPDRRFPVLSKKLLCPNMRLTGLTDVYRALLGTGGAEIRIDPAMAEAAKRPIMEMIRLGE